MHASEDAAATLDDEKLVAETELCFRIPANMIISGPTSSGKTTTVKKVVRHAKQIFNPAPKSIVYAYGEYHDEIPEIKNMVDAVVAGAPTEEFLDRLPTPLLLIMDDLMLMVKDAYLQELFTKKSHHKNMFVVFLTQNCFDRNLRVARMNSQYIILMRSPSAALHVRNLGTQLFPRQLNYFMDAYRQATAEPYGYLLIDLHPATQPHLRLRTNIFPGEEHLLFAPA